jgi:hypothetical protein
MTVDPARGDITVNLMHAVSVQYAPRGKSYTIITVVLRASTGHPERILGAGMATNREPEDQRKKGHPT